MGKINRLPEQVINQIAAGEVVERPASVVKELVENSLDAGASQIDVYIEDGGSKLIRVVDNGSGMDTDDLANAVARHFTSKVSSVDDLINLTTLGFRGEALASIAAVSNFTIRSRAEGTEHGFSVDVESGEPQSPEPVGMPVGTEVLVRGLFYNLPARKNFLKTAATEFAHISDLIRRLVLVHPTVSMSLHHNHREVLRVGSGGVEPRISEVMGAELTGQLLPVTAEDPHLKVNGWVGRPGVGVAQRPRQYVFVNGRPVEDKTLWAAVHKGYGSLLGRQEKAQFILLVEIAPHLVDVNVHPQKKEVRFTNPSVVFQLVQQAVGKSLQGYSPAVDHVETPLTSPTQDQHNKGYPPHRTPPPPSLYDRPAAGRWARSPLAKLPVLPPVEDAPVFHASEQGRVFQLLDLFIFEEVIDGIMVYDQHAVHERVLYERLVQEFTVAVDQRMLQPLLVPVVLTLTVVEMETWRESLPVLERLGFVAQERDETTVEIYTVPAALAGVNVAQVLIEYLSELTQQNEVGGSDHPGIDVQTHRRLAYLSCRSAIKAGDRLEPIEVERLLADYHQTKLRFTCPHGRPVQVKIARAEMEKWFRR